MPRVTSTAKTSDAIEHLQDDLQSLRDDVTQLTRQLEGLLRDTGNDALDEVMVRLGRAKSTVDGLLANAGTKSVDAARAARDIKDTVVGEVEDAVRDHPLATIAVAVGIGFMLSLMRR